MADKDVVAYEVFIEAKWHTPRPELLSKEDRWCDRFKVLIVDTDEMSTAIEIAKLKVRIDLEKKHPDATSDFYLVPLEAKIVGRYNQMALIDDETMQQLARESK